MDITSIYFICFFVILFLCFYFIQVKYQWIILLIGSLFFYGYGGLRNICFILITAFTTYIATLMIEKNLDAQKAYIKENKNILSKEERTSYKKRQQTYRKTVMILTLVLNFGLLSYFKYIHFLIDQINILLSFGMYRTVSNDFTLIIPLGISFYTFQTMGYLIDVYWGEVDAEHNFFKVLLFVSFFPQIIQGPISNFSTLSKELFKEHIFSIKKYRWGLERVLWGFFKKMVIANALSPYVQDVFKNYSSYAGVTVLFGAFMYSIQIYADFSGYMDIVCGLCEMLDIKLAENFERPYFSKSIAEYWRRWHMTLGEWFKRYIYYPVATAKWNQKLAKKMGKRASVLPASIALVVVWMTTGLWHGASWAYIAWGAVNGLFIIFSLWMEPIYASLKNYFHVDEKLFIWKLFQVVRTFILVTFIKVLPEVGTLREGIGLIGRIFTNYSIPGNVKDLLPFVENFSTFNVIIIGTILLLVSSLLQRKKPVREYFDIIPIQIQIPILALFSIIIVYYGIPVSNGIQFMYAQF